MYETSVGKAAEVGVGHLSRLELLGLLKGKGQGAAKWGSALEVMMARKYVEEWGEHLLDYRAFETKAAARKAAAAAFKDS